MINRFGLAGNAARALRVDELHPHPQLVPDIATEFEIGLHLARLVELPDVLWWRNHGRDEGTTSDPFEVARLISLVGTNEHWTFLTFVNSRHPERHAQCCGGAVRGVAVEVGARTGEYYAVVPEDARRYPQVNVVGPRWPYWCSLTELVPSRSATRIVLDWLFDLRVEGGMELRRIGPENGWNRAKPWP